MTPLEEYNNEIKRIEESGKIEKSIARNNLYLKREKCNHEFGPLHQIGWVPDIEIMGHACKLCGFTKSVT